MKEISDIELIKIGKIIKTHSFKGELIIKLDIEFDQIFETELFFVLIDGITVPFFTSKIFKPYKASQMLINFDDIDNEKTASQLLGKDIFISNEDFDNETDSEQDNFNGYKVFNHNNLIGTVNGFLNIPSNPILSIFDTDENEILVPYNEHFIEKIDDEKNEIFLILPEGLIDINK
jgi:16S rRNA processing protein RimM